MEEGYTYPLAGWYVLREVAWGRLPRMPARSCGRTHVRTCKRFSDALLPCDFRETGGRTTRSSPEVTGRDSRHGGQLFYESVGSKGVCEEWTKIGIKYSFHFEQLPFTDSNASRTHQLDSESGTEVRSPGFGGPLGTSSVGVETLLSPVSCRHRT